MCCTNHRCMTVWGNDGRSHSFLTSKLDTIDRKVSRHSHLIPDTQFVNPRAKVDSVVNRTLSSPCRFSNSGASGRPAACPQ